MSAPVLSCLKQITKFLKAPATKITLNNEKMPTCTLNNIPIVGFVNIVISLVKRSKNDLLGKGYLDECEVRQWLEYCVTYGFHCNNNQFTNRILQELNSVLETRTYLVGHVLTIADVVVFYTLQELMGILTYQQKEKYLSVSRWFDHIQQNESIKNKNSQVDFSTLYLTCVSVR